MRFKAIIFDRDGVLIDSEPINLDSAIQSFAKQGIELTKKEKQMIIGTHPVDYKAYFNKKYPNFDFARYRAEKKELYLKSLADAPLFNKIINLIKRLHKKNMPLALVTSSTQNGTMLILKRTGLKDAFQAIVTFEDCEKRKPAPDCYLIAADKLNVKAKDCLAIEDTSIGLQAAKKAGMTCYVIPTEITKNQDFSQADKILESAHELGKML